MILKILIYVISLRSIHADTQRSDSFGLLHWTAPVCSIFHVHFLMCLWLYPGSCHIKGAEMNVLIRGSLYIFVFLPSKVEIWNEPYGVSVFIRYSTKFSFFFFTMVVSVYISTKSLSEFPFPYILTAIHKYLKIWRLRNETSLFCVSLIATDFKKMFTSFSLVFSINCWFSFCIFLRTLLIFKKFILGVLYTFQKPSFCGPCTFFKLYL